MRKSANTSPYASAPAQPPPPTPMGGSTRQYILETAQGLPGNGIATVSGELQLFVIAYLPPPSTLVNLPTACYVVYLVDKKGQQGFAVGQLAPTNEGFYQLSFQSGVPLHYYTRVVISIENPLNIQAYPQGPIILKVKDDFAKGAFNKAGSIAKRMGGFVQEKAGGFLRNRFGKTPALPEGAAATAAQEAAAQNLNTAGAATEAASGITAAPPLTAALEGDPGLVGAAGLAGLAAQAAQTTQTAYPDPQSQTPYPSATNPYTASHNTYPFGHPRPLHRNPTPRQNNP